MNKIYNSKFSVFRRKKTHRGFTLIETFVAISILLVSLAGPLSLAAQALKTAYYARDEVTAFYLAQEGLEFARVFRDQNLLAGKPAFTNFGPSANILYNVDFPHLAVAPCPGNVCPPLLLDSNNLFNIQQGTPSLFTRSLTVSAVPGTTDEEIVKVKVSWVSGAISRSFQLSEHLFNWL